MKTVLLYLTRDCNTAARFEYDADMIARIKALQGRRWSAIERAWVFAFSPEIFENVKYLFESNGYKVNIHSSITEKLKALKNLAAATLAQKEIDPDTVSFGGYKFTREPARHQKKGLYLTIKNKHFGLLMEMGTGKTKVILDLLGVLKEAGHLTLQKFALILCPASILDVWPGEAKKDLPSLKITALMGSVAAKAEIVEKAEHEAYVLNYESAWREPMSKVLKARKPSIIVLDESTAIKHRTSKQARVCLDLAKTADRRHILTGTPAPKGPLDLYNQLRFLDPALVGNSFYTFRERYCVLGGYGSHQIIGTKNLEELNFKLSSCSYRVKKEECLDLPPKLYQVEKIDLGPEQKRVYKDLAEKLVAEVKGLGTVSTDFIMTKTIRLKQITAGLVQLDDGRLIRFKGSENSKLEWLRQYLSDRFTSTSKLIIWTMFIEELESILELCKELGINAVRFDGSVPISKRGAIVEAFQNDSKCQVFVGQQKAGGFGITLTAADSTIFFSNGFMPDIRIQCEDRVHRRGQTKSVIYLDVLARGTVDVSDYARLKKELAVQETLTADRFKNYILGEGEYESF